MTLDAEDLFQHIQGYLSPSDRLQVEQALEFARREHGDQRRKSGELFFTHPLAVATYLAEYRLDADALSAALLHDIAEDTRVSLAEIEALFGDEVATLVAGVTKLKEVTRGVAAGEKLTGKELQEATLQRLFRAMTSDVRTVIIKLFDRLHNMRTIEHLSRHKQIEKATETLNVFAPMANRLGMWDVKSELEGRALAVLEPEAYETIVGELARLHHEQQPFAQTVTRQILDLLGKTDVQVYAVRPSPENVYTVYSDLVRHGSSYRDVDRMLRLTVLVDDPITCYTALGYLHNLWKAVPLQLDDYISVPRENLYQSLHTTVVHNSGRPIKIRLRTVDMDRVAQVGVLARWLYAGTPLWSAELAERIDLLFRSINESISVEPHNPGLGVQSVVEVLGEQIRVYTPRGDAVELPLGATPIDFAYRIHTKLGNQCHAAFVNDLPFPLNRPLRNGDQVRIVKSLRAEPQRAWLDRYLGFITTTYAQMHARRWFRRLSEAEAIRQGRELLEHELTMLGLGSLSHDAVAASLGSEDADTLYYRLGRAELLPTVLATRIMSDYWDDGPCLPLDSTVYAADGSKYVITKADNRRLRICSTCNPRPRDSIVGFIRQDGVITVHREGCHTLNATRQRPDVIHRRLKLGWGEAETREARLISLNVEVYDRPGLLHEMTNLMREQDVNIPHICTYGKKGVGEVGIELKLEVISPQQMVRILHQLEALVNVKTVRRIPDQAPDSRAMSNSLLYKPE